MTTDLNHSCAARFRLLSKSKRRAYLKKREAASSLSHHRRSSALDVPIVGLGSPTVRSIIFRALRKLLVNIAMHAKVRRALVRIHHSSRNILVFVEDKSVGFNPNVIHEPRLNSGFGLFNIRERLEYLGGKMNIQSVCGNKTRITLSMPLVMKTVRPTEGHR